jgi:predicted transcriptional regulator
MKAFTIRVDDDVHAWLTGMAEREDRSLAAQVHHLLKALWEQTRAQDARRAGLAERFTPHNARGKPR